MLLFFKKEDFLPVPAPTITHRGSGSRRALIMIQHHMEKDGEVAALERRWAMQLKDLPPADAAARLRAALGGPAPRDVVAMRRLARIVVFDPQREKLLKRAVELAPDYAEGHLDLAILLFRQHRNAEALPHFKFLAEHAPGNVTFRASLALCHGDIGDYAAAIELYEGCREAFKADAAFQVNYADALKYAGRRDDCVATLRSAVERKPGNGPAWWSLANVKTEIFSGSEIKTMLALLGGTSLSQPDRYHIHYALGRAFEQGAEYEASFAHYSRGATLKRADISFDDSGSLAMAARVKQFFTAARFAGARNGCPDPAPIFILGMPRAGSTLVEQILASHSQVEGTMELPEISYIVRDIGLKDTDGGYPETLAGYDAEALAALGRRYIVNTAKYRSTDKAYYIDKMPSNCAHVGLIHMILPNARIIDVMRDPMANCFAAFKQLFGRGVGYSYDFEELARYYRIYVDSMEHFDHVLPGRMHHVRYEDIVNNTEAEIRRLLAYCGLAFEPACLRFWESARAVATPSAEQVRRPIFRDGLHSWRNYDPWLGPLKEFLAVPIE